MEFTTEDLIRITTNDITAALARVVNLQKKRARLEKKLAAEIKKGTK